MIEAGACGLKLHEDWGTTLAVIDTSLTVADEYDIQIAIHTDTLNECGFIDDSIAAIKGRAIHSFHTEGAGGGHAPDIIKIAGLPNVLPSSTNPTRPFTVNTIDEHLDMLMVCHHLSRRHPRGRGLRREPHPGRDDRRRGRLPRPRHHQHDELGLAGDGPDRRGDRPDLADRPQDEGAVRPAGRRQLAATTTSASSATSPSTRSTRRSPTASPTTSAASSGGKLADLVLYEPAYFGVKPFLILKGGLLVAAQMGDPNASIATPQPVYMRPQFAAYGRALSKSCLSFVSKAALDERDRRALRPPARGGGRRELPDIGKKDMQRNEATPEIRVDADTYQVWVDGEKVGSEPLEDAADDPALFPVLKRRMPRRRAVLSADRPSTSENHESLPASDRRLGPADQRLYAFVGTGSGDRPRAGPRPREPGAVDRSWLRTSLGPLEGVLVASSLPCGPRGRPAELRALNRLAEVSIMPPSIRAASREMGEQLLALGATWAWCAAGLAPFLQEPCRASPTAGTTRSPSACSGRSRGGEPEDVLTAYLHQAALGMIGAGVRAIPVGHTHGQQVLAYLHDDIRNLAAELVDREPETAGAGCPFYEVLCDEQTRLYARMFRS